MTDPFDDPDFLKYHEQCAKDCHCCGVCSPVVCCSVFQGAPCEMRCRCDDERDTSYDDDPDYAGWEP